MEVGGVAGENDHGAGRIGVQLLSVELITNPDVENAGNDRIDPILGVFVRHQLHTTRYLDPDRVGTGLRRLTNENCKPCRRRECRKRLPVDLFRQNCSENVLARLMRSKRCLFDIFSLVGDIETTSFSCCSRCAVLSAQRNTISGRTERIIFICPPRQLINRTKALVSRSCDLSCFFRQFI